MSEIIFEVREDELDGGYVATALGYGIVTEGDSLDELRAMVKEAVHCHFGDGVPGPMPRSFASISSVTKCWRRENAAGRFRP